MSISQIPSVAPSDPPTGYPNRPAAERRPDRGRVEITGAASDGPRDLQLDRPADVRIRDRVVTSAAGSVRSSLVSSSVSESVSCRSAVSNEHVLADVTATVAKSQSATASDRVTLAAVSAEASWLLQTGRRLDDAVQPDVRMFEHAPVAPVALSELMGQHYRFLTNPNAVEAASRILASRPTDGREEAKDAERARLARRGILGSSSEDFAAAYRSVFEWPTAPERNGLNSVA